MGSFFLHDWVEPHRLKHPWFKACSQSFGVNQSPFRIFLVLNTLVSESSVSPKNISLFDDPHLFKHHGTWALFVVNEITSLLPLFYFFLHVLGTQMLQDVSESQPSCIQDSFAGQGDLLASEYGLAIMFTDILFVLGNDHTLLFDESLISADLPPIESCL